MFVYASLSFVCWFAFVGLHSFASVKGSARIKRYNRYHPEFSHLAFLFNMRSFKKCFRGHFSYYKVISAFCYGYPTLNTVVLVVAGRLKYPGPNSFRCLNFALNRMRDHVFLYGKRYLLNYLSEKRESVAAS